MDTTLSEEAPATAKTRRSDGLVGNALVLAAVVGFLCEFVGIIASGVHTMPTLPGSSTHELVTAYRHQTGPTGFVVGWYSLVLPFRVLIVLGLRQALLASTPERFGSTWRTLLSWAVGLMALGVAAELASVCVDAATAAAFAHGSSDVVFALDHLAHYLQVALYCPSGMATALVGAAMWRSGVFPRALAGLVTGLSAVQLVSGALLSGPSTAALQDGLTVLNLLSFVVLLWGGVLVFRHRSRAERA
jgi:hypothetical protein